MLSDYAVRVLFINAPETAVMDTITRAFAEVDSTGMLGIERWCVENGQSMDWMETRGGR